VTKRTASIAIVGLILVWSFGLAAQTTRSDTIYDAVRTNSLSRLRPLVATAADANVRDEEQSTPLMYAAAVGSTDAVKLLLDNGADVNAQNGTGLTALMFASTDLPKTRLLLDRGANPNLASKLGRTPLFLAAMSQRSADIVRALVGKGADLKTKDTFGNTFLMAAASGNDTDTIRIGLDAGIDVNAAPVTGFTPLMESAAAGNVTAVRLLLGKGANVNAVSQAIGTAPGPDPKSGPVNLRSYTPLLLAASSGSPGLIAMLLDAGADINATDARKLTPLMLATAADHQNLDVMRLLIQRGADQTLRGTQLGTAAEWATKLGAPEGIALLRAEPHQPAPRVVSTEAPLDARTAAARSLALLEKTSEGFFEGSGCVSCHAQSITDMTAGELKAKGVRIDEKAAAGRIEMLRTGAIPPFMLRERMDIGVPEIIMYQLAGLAAVGHKADRTTDAMVMNVAATQAADGGWHAIGLQQRPGGEDGEIFRTALGIRALKAYGPPALAADMDARVASARRWMVGQPVVTAEDRAMQLLGLYWSGADKSAMQPFVAKVRSTQQPDGGWKQREGLGTDAYATGESLYALAKGGLSTSDPAFKKGIQYLLSTQRPSDGSWRVESRTAKFQSFFQSGFPYAGDQWISQWATGWATMALAQALDMPAPAPMRAAR
jgi:ankyrin repeat protein